MDPISAIASIAGIVGFGIQVAQILQEEIDAIQTATERVAYIVFEIRALATGLRNLSDFLQQAENTSASDRIFNDEGHNEIALIVRRCNNVFRNMTVLVAKAGDAVLSNVDHFQSQFEEERKKRIEPEKSSVKLEIKLWRLPRIEQYIVDLDRLKLSLVLILSVANLAKPKKAKEYHRQVSSGAGSLGKAGTDSNSVMEIQKKGKGVGPRLWFRMRYFTKTERQGCDSRILSQKMDRSIRSPSDPRTKERGTEIWGNKVTRYPMSITLSDLTGYNDVPVQASASGQCKPSTSKLPHPPTPANFEERRPDRDPHNPEDYTASYSPETTFGAADASTHDARRWQRREEARRPREKANSEHVAAPLNGIVEETEGDASIWIAMVLT